MLFENIELMDPDLVLEVPDTPDRVAKLNNGQSQNSVHNKISTMEDKQLLFHRGRGKAEGAVSRQRASGGYNTEELFHQANKARLLSEPFDSKSSPDVEDRHGQNGVSTKNKESMERNIISCPRNCRDYRRKLVKGAKSGDSELLGDQRNKKSLGFGSCLPPITHPRSQCGITISQEEKNILSEGARSVSRPRNDGKQVCLSGGSHSKSEQETSTGLSVDKLCSPLGVKKLVRNGCISPCNTTKSSSLPSNVCSQCGPTSLGDDKSTSPYVVGNLDIFEAVTKDDVNLLPKRMQSEMHKMTSDISSKNKGKALADDHVGATGQIGKSSSSRSIRRHGLEMNITKDTDDIVLDSEVLIRTESDKPTDKAHRAFSSKGANISMGEESINRQLKNSNEADIRYNDCSTIVLDSPESARYPEGTRRRSTRGKRKYTPTIASGECSSSAPDDYEVSYIGTSLQSSSSKFPRAYNTRSRSDVLRPVIEVDEILSPEVMRNGVREQSLRVRNQSSAINMQLESDELLARQLQEQLYNESPTIATGIEEEIDAALALSLQQEEQAHSATSTSRQTNHARRSRLPARASQQLPSRRGINRVRSMNSNTRLAQFLRDIDLRGMDFDSRLDFFEQLEIEYDNQNDTDFSHIQMRRDFTENDYEALLALDDNNHRHTGASRNQINSLPQSIVQTDNVDEPCAVCLENPSVGDTIRHLPCFHKFHKDCIDEWLRRKTSCPVCKISVI